MSNQIKFVYLALYNHFTVFLSTKAALVAGTYPIDFEVKDQCETIGTESISIEVTSVVSISVV
jgi:hypothetical protein